MGVELSPIQIRRRFRKALPYPLCTTAPPRGHRYFDVTTSAMFTGAEAAAGQLELEQQQQRGVKRKARLLEEDSSDEEQDTSDEELDEELSSASSTSSEDEDDEEEPDAAFAFRTYSRRRYMVFNMSVHKLSRFRQAADPSLLRSVLVCNTLRNLERELEREGIKVTMNSNGTTCMIRQSCPSPPQSQPFSGNRPEPGGFSPTYTFSQRMTLDPPPTITPPLTPPPSLPPLHHPYPSHHPPTTYHPYDATESAVTPQSTPSYAASNDYDRYLVDMDSSSGRLTPFVRSCDSNVLWSDDGADRLPSLNWSSVLNVGSNPVTPAPQGGSLSPPHESSSTSLYTLMPPTSGSPSSTSVLTNIGSGTDEIFGDIDLSLYDFDLLSPISTPAQAKIALSDDQLSKNNIPSSTTITTLTTCSSMTSASMNTNSSNSSCKGYAACSPFIGGEHLTVMS